MSEKEMMFDQYYRLQDPKERLLLLQKQLAEDPCKDNQRRMELYNQRYTSEGYDLFLRAFLDLTVTKADAGFFVKKSTLKFVKKDMEMLLLTQEADELLHQEWYHLARFYISLCMKDTRFSTSAFGLSHLKDEQIKNKIAAQIHHATILVPMQFELQNHFTELNHQFELAFCDMFEDGNTIWQENQSESSVYRNS